MRLLRLGGLAIAGVTVVSAQGALNGTYDAISNTAMSITGNVVVSDGAVACALDQTYTTNTVGRAVGASDYGKGAGSWAALFGAPDTAPVDVRQVTAERVGPKARNKGMCAPAKTTFLALVATVDATGDRTLKLAAFKGATAPGPDADPADLCGTFMYAPVAGKR